MDDRREAILEYLGKTVRVIVDRPLGHIHKGTVYPINYGYIPGMIAGDGEEQDAYILGVTEPLTEFEGVVIGAVERLNDCEDKFVVVPAGMRLHQAQIAEAVHFQEQYFHIYIHSLYQKSCGVLPYRQAENGREYLIVYEQFSQCWSLPKGRMEPGETEKQAALRELWEETGLTAQLDAVEPASVEYPIFTNGCKEVLFFPGKVSGTPTARDGEIERCKWVKAEELGNYLFPDTTAACTALITRLSATQ